MVKLSHCVQAKSVFVSTRQIFFASVLLCLQFVRSALASETPCTVGYATSLVELKDLKLENDAGKIGIPLLAQIQDISDKAKNQNEAIGSQLSKQDNEKFGELRQQFLQIEFFTLIQSELARDAEVASDMREEAWSIYSNPNFQFSADIRKNPGNILILLRGLLPDSDTFTPSTDRGCTVDLALSDEIKTVNAQLWKDIPSLENADAEIDALRAKYNLPANAKIDPSKMSSDDQQTWDTLSVEVRPAMADIALANDLQNIRDWWNIALLEHDDGLEDLQITSDPSHIGDTFKEENFPPRQITLAKVWTYVDNEIPCVFASDLQKETDVLNRLKPK